MATSIYAWNVSAANNNATPPDGAPENMDYSEVNDTMREMMAVVRRFVTDGLSGANTTAGTQPDYTLAIEDASNISAYATGQVFAFVAHATSTGSVTLDVNSIGALNVIDSRGVQLGQGDIQQNGIYIVVATASAFRVIGHLSSASVTALAGGSFLGSFTTTGSSNAYVVTTGQSLASIPTNTLILLNPNFSNTDAVTLDIDDVGPEALEDFNSQALVSGDISSGEAILAWYNGTEWRILTGIPIDVASQVSGVLPEANGGTGQTTFDAAIDAHHAGLSAVDARADDEITIFDDSDSNNAKATTARQLANRSDVIVTLLAFPAETDVETGNVASNLFFRVPESMSGYTLTNVEAGHLIASSGASGTTTFQVSKSGTDMLSTPVTIDADELFSSTAATPAVIKSDGSEIISQNNFIAIDVDAVPSGGTQAIGLCVNLTFRAP